MEKLVDFLVSNELLVVYALIFIMIILIIVITIVDHKSRKSKKTIIEEIKNIEKETQKEEQVLNEIVENDIVTDNIATTESIETSLDNSVIKIEELPNNDIITNIETDIVKEPEEEIEIIELEEQELRKKAQEELERLTLELQKKEEEDRNKVIEFTNFEIEQEENAIISYNDLIKVSNELYDENEVIQYEDEGNEPINIEELRAKFNNKEEPIIAQDPIRLEEFIEEDKKSEPLVLETKKFKSSPVISPVFGVEKEDVISNSSIELENTANLDKLDEEIKRTNSFLQTLKELQKKLD